MPSTACASSASVGAWKIVRSATFTPSSLCIRAASVVAFNEWPPNSKKLSFAPTRSTPSTLCHSSASSASNAVPGATYAAPASACPSGAGSAFRSTFPFGVSGILSNCTK
ncbi:hypothetical protein D3C84_751260 [compost metagenome]